MKLFNTFTYSIGTLKAFSASAILAMAVLPLSVQAAPSNTLDMFKSSGDPEKTLAWYTSEQINLDAIADSNERASAYHMLGRAYYQVGNTIEAQTNFAKAIDLIGDQPADPILASAVYNDMGLALVARTNLEDALVYFNAAEGWAGVAESPAMSALSGINLVRTMLESENYDRVPELIAKVTSSLDASTPDPRLARNWLSVGQLIRKAVVNGVLEPESRLDALQSYINAQTMAGTFKDQGLNAYANGYLGELYEDEGRYEDSVAYTRKAIFEAQAIADDTSLYKWQWQMARLLKMQGQAKESVAQYRQAVETLNRSRTSLTLGAGINFKQSVGPVFYEFADLLLKQSFTLTDEKARQANLEEVIDVLEAVKLAEVEDYFDSECVVLPDQKIKLADVMSDAAVIYPILLRDRTELLVQLPSGIEQFSVDVSASQLRDTVNEYRSLIETYDRENGYLGPSQLLYSWLIQPAEKVIQKADVSTLVFVPDGPLRSIPISALHDGEQFLVQKYAVATTPGITLTDPKPFSREDIRVLASGLTEGVQGYSPLPSVQQELKNISKVFETELYQDSTYQLQTVEGEMSSGGFNIVHFATHGEFNSDHNKSFLLTYDNKLTMNQLENTIGLRRFQSEPIELLVLSACQTAVGDDQAALGLAGVAIKAGARSALATLWFINDQATSALVADFYRQLNKDKQTKAKALQTAQINMITQTQYKHPSFWAPFLMIGNWM